MIIPISCMGSDELLDKKESNTPLIPDLVKTVDSFANEHSLQFSDVTKLLNHVIFEQKITAKGGVGALGAKSYIDLISPKNKIILADGSEWIGKENNVSQIVILLNGRIVEQSSEMNEVESLMVVVFNPDRVQVYDLKKLVGGYFLRK